MPNRKKPKDQGLAAPDDDFIVPGQVEKEKKFEEVFAAVLPHLGHSENKIILAQILITLKLEGILGKDINEKEEKMVNIIKDSVLSEPEKKQEALRNAYRLLEGR